MTVNTNPNLTLPEEIIYDILARVSVKSLLRFRCVSKLWLSLISSPQFVKFHLSKSIENTRFTHHKLILSFPYPNYNLMTCSVNSVLNVHVFEAIELNYPLKNPSNPVYVVGSCNGLVCLIMDDEYLFMWNPSTRKSRFVYSDMNLQNENCPLYGFGYDECSDDYKVVRMDSFYGDDVCETQVRVYSSKSDCWKRIGDFPFEPWVDCGKFINGALHWKAYRDIYNDSSDSLIIVSLDIKRETYGEILQPKYGEGNYDLKLWILSGYLSVLCNYENTRADIWIMKEYGVKESWTKLVTIPHMDGFDGLWSYKNLTPLHISVNGDMVVEYRGRIQLYDSKDNIFRNLEPTNISDCIEADTCIESLVSPIA